MLGIILTRRVAGLGGGIVCKKVVTSVGATKQRCFGMKSQSARVKGMQRLSYSVRGISFFVGGHNGIVYMIHLQTVHSNDTRQRPLLIHCKACFQNPIML